MTAATNWREMPAGRALDAIVAERVYGRTVDMQGGHPMMSVPSEPGWKAMSSVPHYSTDLMAAWLLVDRLRAKRPFKLWDVDGDTWTAEFECSTGSGAHHGVTYATGSGDTAPLAITRAALHATEAAHG